MQKKTFRIKVSRTIKEFIILDVDATNALKARHYAEFEAETDPTPSRYSWKNDSDSLPGKITTEITDMTEIVEDKRTPSDSDE